MISLLIFFLLTIQISKFFRAAPCTLLPSHVKLKEPQWRIVAVSSSAANKNYRVSPPPSTNPRINLSSPDFLPDFYPTADLQIFNYS